MRISLTPCLISVYQYIMKRLLVSLPEETHKRLKHYCVDHETQMSEVIRQLVQEFLEKAEKKRKR